MRLYQELTAMKAHTFYNKAIILKEMGRYEQAIESFDEAININDLFYESWYSKGIILNYLGRYEQAIESFDEAIKNFSGTKENIDIGINLFDLYAARGQGKYNIGDRLGALKDFKLVEDKILSNCKKGRKYNNIGICDHQDGDYKNAQLMYEAAIKEDPTLADAYYNLAILHINNNKIKEAKKSLDKCLDIIGTEREPKVGVKEAARKTKQKLEGSGKLDRSDWYGWWFNSGMGKALFGIVLIAALVALSSPVILMQILVIDPAIEAFFLNHNLTPLIDTITKIITTHTIAALIITAGVLVGILLLPSLRKFKFGTFEFESLPPNAKHPVELDPISQIPSPMEVHMPLKSQPQSFTMPLKYQTLMRQQPLMPIDPVRMPHKAV